MNMMHASFNLSLGAESSDQSPDAIQIPFHTIRSTFSESVSINYVQLLLMEKDPYSGSERQRPSRYGQDSLICSAARHSLMTHFGGITYGERSPSA